MIYYNVYFTYTNFINNKHTNKINDMDNKRLNRAIKNYSSKMAF